MKILFFTQYFPPEIGAGAIRVYEMSKVWVKLGYKVHILSGLPNYPTGKVLASYKKWKFMQNEKIDGINITRTILLPTAYSNIILRILNYISYFFSATIGGLLLKKPDIIIVTSPPLFVGLSAYLISKMKQVPLILDIRDLWPESLVIANHKFEKSMTYKVLHNISSLIYNHSTKIIVVTDGFKEELNQKYNIADEKIDVVKNGVDLTLFKPSDNSCKIDILEGYSNKFIVSYFGTIGISHGVENIVKAAQILRDQKDILLLIIGEGARKKECLELKEKNNLENVVIMGNQPRKRMPQLINASDVFLVSHINAPVFNTFIPSKMFEGMACGKPLIAAVYGDAAHIVEESQSGIVVERENPENLAKAILNLFNDRQKCNRFGDNGIKYVHQYFSREKLANKYIEIVESVQ